MQLTAPDIPDFWQPIDTAPKDGKSSLLLARFNANGFLVELDYDGVWDSYYESEYDSKKYWDWCSAGGIEEPTHWAYQPKICEKYPIPVPVAPEGYVAVPFNPTEDQWDGLGRAIIFWMRSYPSDQHTPATLFKFLSDLGKTIPEWMLEQEAEMKVPDMVISKGTVATLIYKAMLSDAPTVEQPTPAPVSAIIKMDDMVLVPREVIAAACSAIAEKRDAPTLLAHLRQCALAQVPMAAAPVQVKR